MMQHKGYLGKFMVDLDARIIRGHVVGTQDVITFQGTTVDEAMAAFIESVDGYLSYCAESGEEPDKPFSGKLLVRIRPELHRALSVNAEQTGVSLNSLIADNLSALATSSHQGSRRIARQVNPRKRKNHSAGGPIAPEKRVRSTDGVLDQSPDSPKQVDLSKPSAEDEAAVGKPSV